MLECVMSCQGGEITLEAWRDLENNNVYLRYGTKVIEIPHVIVEAYRQLEAESFHKHYAMAEREEKLATENDKLRELIIDMWGSAMVNCHFAERIAFASEFIDRIRELKIEVNNA